VALALGFNEYGYAVTEFKLSCGAIDCIAVDVRHRADEFNRRLKC